MTVSDGDIVRGVLGQTMTNGDEAKAIYTYLIDKVSVGSWSDAEIAGFLETAIEAIYTELSSEIKATATYDLLDVYKWVPPDWDYLTTVVPSFAGSAGGEVLPAGVAMLMTAYTSLNKVFGRKFVYGCTELGLGGGVLTGIALGHLADGAAEYIATYSGGTMGPLDFLIPGVYSSKAVDFVPFNGVAVVKDTLSYQRRRKKGVGT